MPGRCRWRRSARRNAHGAEIGDGLHHGEDRAAGDRRPREPQADPEKGAPGSVSHRARREIGCGRLAQERRPCQQKDIGIEHEDQHQRSAAERADLGKPVVARSPAGDGPQRRLHRPRMIEQVGIGIGQHIGREGQRQRQHDFEDAAAGKAAHRDQPGRPRSRRRRADPDIEGKLHRVPDVTRQDRVPQPEPRVERPARRCNADGGDRDDAQSRADPCEGFEWKMRHRRRQEPGFETIRKVEYDKQVLTSIASRRREWTCRFLKSAWAKRPCPLKITVTDNLSTRVEAHDGTTFGG